jgi:hypothetical protein
MCRSDRFTADSVLCYAIQHACEDENWIYKRVESNFLCLSDSSGLTRCHCHRNISIQRASGNVKSFRSTCETVYTAFHSKKQTADLTSLHHIDCAIVQKLKISTTKPKSMVFHGELHTVTGEQTATVQTTDRKRVDSINVLDNINLHNDSSPWVSDFYRALKTEDLTPVYWFLDLLHRVVFQNQYGF